VGRRMSGWDKIGSKAPKKKSTRRRRPSNARKRKSGVPEADKENLSKEFADLEVEISDLDTLDSIFIAPTPEKKRMRGEKTANIGKTGLGKTRDAMLWGRINMPHIEEDINTLDLPGKKRDHALETFAEALKHQRIYPGNPVIVLGTEESTEECVYGDDQWELFADLVGRKEIRFTEVFREHDSGKNEGFLDYFESFRAFKKALAVVKRANPQTGTVVIDCGSDLLEWQHEIIRRKLMKIPELKKEQGVPPRYWFWRNMEQTKMQMALRRMKCNTVVTWRMAKDKDGEITDKPRWHDDTSGHKSNNVLHFTGDDPENRFMIRVRKCRQTRRLRKKVIFFPAPFKFLGIMIGALDFPDIKPKKGG